MTNRYSTVAIILHWLIALLVITNLYLGLTDTVMQVHKAIGITVLLLTVARIVWRLAHKPPPLQPSLKAWEKMLAKTLHVLFYVLLLILPLSGWAMTSVGKRGGPVDMFGLFEMPALPISDSLGGLGHEMHETLAFVMIALIALHVLGALKHSLVDRIPSLSRMGIGSN